MVTKNISNKNIIGALPLVASILGDRYGIKIEIGGETAYTDGKTIHLPALPLDCDETFINLLRSYLDHEAAHIRFSDLSLINRHLSKPSALLKLLN